LRRACPCTGRRPWGPRSPLPSRAAAPGLRAAAAAVEQRVEDHHGGTIIEAGKQLSGTAESARGWAPGQDR
ncbi:hypothetical protein, partial [Pseudonocardia nigra]|uniref:hypothetical protein n=1 Tax=Pseudonocardia nigra TaxID=1921578 RepID=UPI001C5DDDBA